MEKIMKNKVFIGVILFYIIFIYVGMVLTRNMESKNIVNDVAAIKESI